MRPSPSAFRLALLAASAVSCSLLAPGPEDYVGGVACAPGASACANGGSTPEAGSSVGAAPSGGSSAAGSNAAGGGGSVGNPNGGSITPAGGGANEGGTTSASGTTASGGEPTQTGGAAGVPTEGPCDPAATPLGPNGTWTLDFCDDFDGPELDTTKWGIGFGWGTMSNTVAGPIAADQVGVENGNAVLKAYTNGSTRESSGINTFDGYRFTYGYVEARLRAARGSGLETVGSASQLDFAYPPWLAPVDVAGSLTELNPSVGPTVANLAYVTPDGKYVYNTVVDTAAPFTEQFHTYGMLWSPTSIALYLDGKRVLLSAQSTVIPAKSMYLRMEVNNCPASGYKNCPATIGPTYQPALIDYVRVWKAP